MKFNNRKNRKQIGKRITALALLGVMAFSSSFQSLAKGETVENYDSSKTAKVIDWDERTYEIDIEAQAKGVQVSQQIDTTYGMLVLDRSSSMYTPYSEYYNYWKNYLHEDINKPISELVTDNPLIYDMGRYADNLPDYDEPKFLLIHRSDGWYIYDQTTNLWHSGDNITINNQTLIKDGLLKRRACYHFDHMTYLREVAVDYVDRLASSASNSKLGIIMYPDSNSNVHQELIGVTTTSSNQNALVEKILAIQYSTQGSDLGVALKKAYCQFFDYDENTDTSTPKQVYLDAQDEDNKIPLYVIAVTDGAVDNRITSENWANKLKGEGFTVYTVSINPTTDDEDWLASNVASPGCAFSTDTASGLDDIFDDIVEKYITYEIPNVTVKDYIDDRFVIVNEAGEDFDPEEGNTLEYSYNGKNAVVGRDDNGLYIEWRNQKISGDTSNWKVKVKAREDYLGGNNVTTNKAGSVIITPNNSAGRELDQPKVNVKAVLNVDDATYRVYKGETPPTLAEIQEQLFDVDAIALEKYKLYPSMFELNWYSDQNCTTPISSVGTELPDEYYLKVTYKAGRSEDESLTNTTLSGKAYQVGDEVEGKLDSTDIGTYTINVWELIKRNALDKNVLGNAEFTISKDGKTYYGKSDETGFVAWFTDNEYTTPANAMDAGTYTLTETAAPTGYTLNTGTSTLTKDATTGWTVPSTGGIIAEVDANKAYVDNTPTSDVTVKKIVDGNLGETTRAFEFKAVLKDANDQIVDFPEVNAKKGKVNADKSLTFDLEHNEEFVFEDLVVGYTIEITETKATVHDGNEYVLTVDGHDTFTGMTATKKVPFNQNPTITFKNTRQANILTGVVNNTPILPIMMLAIIAMALVVFKIRLNNERARRLADARSLRK